MYLLKMFFSNSCFIIFKWEKVVFTTIALYVGGGGCYLFAFHVCVFPLVSIVSCCHSIHVFYGFFMPL